MRQCNNVQRFSCQHRDAHKNTRRTRRDWVRGDVRCVMCARLVGRLLGARDHFVGSPRTLVERPSFFAYRANAPDAAVVAYLPGMRLRCTACGGAAALEDLEYFSTYDEQPGALEDDDLLRRGRGRPRSTRTLECCGASTQTVQA